MLLLVLLIVGQHSKQLQKEGTLRLSRYVEDLLAAREHHVLIQDSFV